MVPDRRDFRTGALIGAMVDHKELPGTVPGMQTFNSPILWCKRSRCDRYTRNIGNLVAGLVRMVGTGHCCAGRVEKDEGARKCSILQSRRRRRSHHWATYAHCGEPYTTIGLDLRHNRPPRPPRGFSGVTLALSLARRGRGLPSVVANAGMTILTECQLSSFRHCSRTPPFSQFPQQLLKSLVAGFARKRFLSKV
jgi:hypothetical protein